MKLRFPKEGVLRLIEHTQKHPKMLSIYGKEPESRPHLILVGDDGVYLGSGSEERLPGEDTYHFVVYAEEINPNTVEFDLWWERKRASFGGDDGIEPVYVDDILRALGPKYLTMNLTPGQIHDGIPGTMELVVEGA